MSESVRRPLDRLRGRLAYARLGLGSGVPAALALKRLDGFLERNAEALGYAGIEDLITVLESAVPEEKRSASWPRR